MHVPRCQKESLQRPMVFAEKSVGLLTTIKIVITYSEDGFECCGRLAIHIGNVRATADDLVEI